MKLVFRQYLESLRERKELDVVLPDLLSELGFNVISRPTIGSRQYGVDVMAIGQDQGEAKVFLFSIKKGDLTRAEWNSGEQSLKPSIEEIIEVYCNTSIPDQFKSLKIVICMCFGGEIHEALRVNVAQFTAMKTTERISFQEWNGDYIAGLLMEGILGQQLVSKELRGSFQKSIAMLDEPDIAFQHFSSLIRGMLGADSLSAETKLSNLRRIYICLWVLFVWARDADNLEAPYRASELAILHAWHAIRAHIGQNEKGAKDLGTTFEALVELHFFIWDELYGKKVLPYVGVRHAISTAVSTSTPVDVNLKLFEMLGRLAQRGLWMLWKDGGGENTPDVVGRRGHDDARKLASQISDLISNNPSLLSPIADAQSIDISVALVFLSMFEEWQSVALDYCDFLMDNFVFTYRYHGRYPTIYGAYWELIEHPKEQTQEYRKRHTQGSTLLPLLCVWGSASGTSEFTQVVTAFVKSELVHCNLQTWVPGQDSESMLYIGPPTHGWALTEIPFTPDGEQAMEMLQAECKKGDVFASLSAINLGHWPVLVMACRHHRLPLPPHLWMPVLIQMRTASVQNH